MRPVFLSWLILIASAAIMTSGASAQSSSVEAGIPAQLVLEGSVVDPEGAPVSGAEIRILHYRGAVAIGETEPLAATDKLGRFRIVLGKAELNEEGRELLDPYSMLVASKAGYGASWGRAFCFEKAGEIRKRLTQTERELFQLGRHSDRDVLRLVPDTVFLRGRLLNEDGIAVSGAKIAVYSMMDGLNGNLDEWERAAADSKATFVLSDSTLRDQLYSGGREGFTSVPQVTTDAEGHFVVRGIGDERIVSLIVHAENHESAILRARTRPGETRRLPQDLSNPEGNVLIYRPCEFEHRLPRVRPLEGQVTDEHTGRPITGVSITFHTIDGPHSNGLRGFLTGSTDPTGMFRIPGLPSGSSGVIIRPPADSPYIVGSAYVEGANGRFPFQRLQLTPGILLRGDVADSQSRQPIRGSVTYVPLKRNPLSRCASLENAYRGAEVKTDPAGKYQIAVLSGEGVLAFRADDDAAYENGMGVQDVRKTFNLEGDLSSSNGPVCLNVTWFHSLNPVNVTTETLGPDFRLTRAASIRGSVAGFKRKPESILRVYGLAASAYWQECDNDDFVIQGYAPGTGRRVTVVSEPENLAGAIEVIGPPPKEVTIKLGPGGRIRGRLVDPNGKPQPNLVLYEGDDVEAFPAPSSRKKAQHDRGTTFDCWKNRELLTDEEGRFEVWGVVPGLKYTLGAEGDVPDCGDCYLGEIYRDIVVKPGETRDLGDIVVLRTADKQEVRTVVGP